MVQVQQCIKLILTACLIVVSNCLKAQTGQLNQIRPDTIRVQTENDIFRIRNVPIPQGLLLEVGGMTFLPNDALAVSTRRGEVWIISNPYMKDGTAPKYRLFAQGMHEVLGLNYINGELYAAQRSELTRLRDLDGDGEADQYETVYSWPLSGNYHEYSYGPIVDKDGNLVVTLNLGWVGHEESLSKWHGWMIKITPEGKMKPFASGFRSPAAFTMNDAGDIFYAENQGGWVGSGHITHVAEGDFLGHPEGLKWANVPESPVKLKAADIPDTGEPKYEVAKRVPGLKPPSVWLPHTILGISTSDILNYDGKGKMGPFEGQMFVGDQGQSKIMRVALEKVKGVYQGVVFPFREGFSSGILRMKWGSDGSMLVGMTSRGWGSTGRDLYGLQRMEWSGVMPFEIKTVKAMPDGFEFEFTMPVDEKSARNPESYKFSTFTYKYHHTYGSPVINQGSCPIKAIAVSADRLKVRLVLDSLKLGYIHELKAAGVRSGDNYALMHNFGYYTLNNIPDGQKLAITAANKVSLAVVHDHMAMNTRTAKPAKPIASAKHVTTQPVGWMNGPDRTFTIGTRPGLKFDLETITVKTGSNVKLTFTNNDDMLHNLVITEPASATAVGEQAMRMGLSGQGSNYVPLNPKVLFHTILLQPGKSDTIYFTAPDKPGSYEYLCSYPGHFMVMRGILKVEN